MLSSVGISTDFVSVAVTALDKHSQNDLVYDPNKVRGITAEQLELCDDIMDWADLPFNTKTSMEDFKAAYYPQ